MRSYLVTGGSGFLGSYLISALLSRGDQVVALTRPHRDIDSRCIVVHAELSELDIRTKIPHLDYSACFHFAGASSVPRSWSNPLEDFRSSVALTVSLLNFLASSHPNCKLFVSSSAAVYGNPRSLPIQESATVAPISPYGIHRAVMENLCEHYSRITSLSVTILRIFSAYGRGLRKQLLWDTVRKLIDADAKGNHQVSMWGTGEETRDFIHASDVASAALCLADSPMVGNYNVVNIASAKETRVHDIVHMLCECWSSPLSPVFSGEVRVGDPQRWQADMSMLSSLGYKPKVALPDGVADFVDWARDQQNSPIAS